MSTNPAFSDIYTFPYTTLFRSRGGIRHDRRNLSDSGFLGQHYEASPEPRWGPTAEPRAEHHRAHQDAHRSCHPRVQDRKSTRLNSSHVASSYAVFCLKKKKNT